MAAMNTKIPYITLLLICASILVTAVFYLSASVDPILFLFISESYGRALPELQQGQVWRLLTPVLVHLDVFHCLVNVIGLWLIGAQLERYLGAWRYGGFIIVTAIFSNLAQFYFAGANFGGLSGILYAQLALIWGLGMWLERSPFYLPTYLLALLAVYYVASWLGWLGQMSNMAHTVGLMTGIALAYALARLQADR